MTRQIRRTLRFSAHESELIESAFAKSTPWTFSDWARRVLLESARQTRGGRRDDPSSSIEPPSDKTGGADLDDVRQPIASLSGVSDGAVPDHLVGSR